jgi:hypothetical protein
VAVCIVGLVAIPFLTGCATLESGSIWNITIRNDTRRFVIVSDCKTSACSLFRYAKHLSPGATARASDYGDGTSWWRVTNRSGERLGCLTLGLSKRVEGYTLLVSSLTACP